ncbi:hypothetical protein Q0812_03600 [Brevundimonas sp. 2R-24]|uniref:ECF transporter S component n=1 Tax=Peiella sedimenti TaxID=3061083 RepID=A0ABT8SIW1_9CAUL|nr:hypothetical protein [Caulobacteraceae bacterium XZ-24]
MPKARLAALTALVLTAALLRIVPHPPNFAPVMAMGLFAGALFPNRWLAVAAPLVALLISDLVLGFYAEMWAIYATLALVTTLGFLLREGRTPRRIAGVTLAGSVIFFALTNFATWALGTMYPHTVEGLAACYAAAIPFFANSLAGDALFAALLFGGFTLLERGFPVLRSQPAAA